MGSGRMKKKGGREEEEEEEEWRDGETVLRMYRYRYAADSL